MNTFHIFISYITLYIIYIIFYIYILFYIILYFILYLYIILKPSKRHWVCLKRKVDMQQLIDDQMKSKLSKQEILRSSVDHNSNSSGGQHQQQQQQQQRRALKFLGLFQRS